MIAQSDFPPVFIEYSRKKMATHRDLVEYLAKFGGPFLKEGAQMVLIAAGEGDKLGK